MVLMLVWTPYIWLYLLQAAIGPEKRRENVYGDGGPLVPPGWTHRQIFLCPRDHHCIRFSGLLVTKRHKYVYGDVFVLQEKAPVRPGVRCTGTGLGGWGVRKGEACQARSATELAAAEPDGAGAASAVTVLRQSAAIGCF